MKRWICSLLVLCCLTGCAARMVEKEALAELTRGQPAVQETPEMPEMPEEPGIPEDFAVCFRSWYIEGQENVLNTYAEGYIQRDQVTGPPVQAAYTASEEALLQIYERLQALELSGIDREMTSAALTVDDTMVAVEPNCQYEIKFRMDGQEYKVCGDSSAWAYRKTDDDAARFVEAVTFLNEVLRNTAEYQSLPEPDSAYE